jgi:hypothetical protein
MTQGVMAGATTAQADRHEDRIATDMAAERFVVRSGALSVPNAEALLGVFATSVDCRLASNFS